MGARNLDKGKTSVLVLSVQAWMVTRLTMTISAVHLCKDYCMIQILDGEDWRTARNFLKFHVQNFPSTEIER